MSAALGLITQINVKQIGLRWICILVGVELNECERHIAVPVDVRVPHDDFMDAHHAKLFLQVLLHPRPWH